MYSSPEWRTRSPNSCALLARIRVKIGIMRFLSIPGKGSSSRSSWCFHADGIFDPADAAARGHGRLDAHGRISEQLRNADIEPLAQLHQFVVSQGQSIMFDLRQRRHGDTRALAHFPSASSGFASASERSKLPSVGVRVFMSINSRHPLFEFQSSGVCGLKHTYGLLQGQPLNGRISATSSLDPPSGGSSARRIGCSRLK